MKIAGWHIEGFGVFGDWRVDDVPESLSLFYGPNEAGKSTLLGFLRFALFGFRGGNAKEPRYPPVAGGRHGGRVWLLGEDTLPAFGGGEDTRAAFGLGEDTRAGGASGFEGPGSMVVERIAAPVRKLDVTLPGEVRGEAADLERLLGHADRALFQNVFAFSLAELQSLASLGEEGVQDHIFSAGITGAGRSARDALRRIEADAAALHKVSRTGKSRIRELTEEIASCDAELATRRRAAEAYPELAAEERAMAGQLETLHGEAEGQREAELQAEKLGDLWREVWSPMEEARWQLAGLPAVKGLPEDAERTLERCLGAVESAGTSLQHVEEDQRACQQKLASLAPAPALAAVADEVETLHRQLSLYETQLKERPLQRQSLAGAESAARDALASLGADWDEARLQGFDVSLESVDQAMQWADRLAASAADLGELERKHADFEEVRERLRVRMAGMLERRDALAAVEVRVLDERAAVLRGLRGRLADCAAARARVEASDDAVELAAGREGRGIVAAWAAPAAAVLAVVVAAPSLLSRFLEARRVAGSGAGSGGFVAAQEWWLQAESALAGLLSPALAAQALGPGSLVISTLLGCFALLLLLLRRQENRRSHNELEELERVRTGARARLGEQLRELARAATSLGLSHELGAGEDTRATGASGPACLGEDTQAAFGGGEDTQAAFGGGEDTQAAFGGGEELDRAEARLEEERRRRQEWERLHLLAEESQRELGECQRELDLLEPCLEAAARRLEEREEGWGKWKREVGAPEGLAPAILPRFFELVQQASASIEARRQAADELGRREAEISAWEERALRTLARAGFDPVGDPASQDEDERAARLLEAFAELRRRCREDQRVCERRQPLEERAVELEGRRVAAAQRLAVASDTLSSLLEAAGAQDEEGFRRNLALRDERRALEEKIRSGEGALDRRVGRGPEAEACRAELVRGRVAEWERQSSRSRDAAARADAERDELLRRHQDLRGQLAELEASSAVAALELQRAELLEELDGAVAEWRRLRVARGLIEATLERFERERQPAVLNEASHYFETVTAGRYRRILQSANSEAFEVVDVNDRRRTPAELSRGTAEQLYVCIRLGLIAEFARRSKRLPVVMDDVLVNFDDTRARAMVGVLRDFAEQTSSQVLFFSCSERTRELFEQAAPEAPRRELPA